MTLQNFPSEILELIFENFDGSTLARARRVCWRWKESVESMETRGAWKTRCLREIDPDALPDMIPYDLTDGPEDPQVWKKVYRRWIQLGRLGRTDCQKTETKMNTWPDSWAVCMAKWFTTVMLRLAD